VCAAYLNVFVGVKEHDTHERQDFFSGAVTWSCEVWQRLNHRSHVVQLDLNAPYQQHLPATTRAGGTETCAGRVQSMPINHISARKITWDRQTDRRTVPDC